MLGRFTVLVLVLGVTGWFLWHYWQFRGCGERTCPPGDAPSIRLATGRELSVLDTRVERGGRLVIEYLTSHDRNDTDALCTEAKAVWESVSGELDTRRIRRVSLGPTSPESEFLGMRFLVLPLYTCCVTTFVPVEKERSGEWSFPQCPPGG